MITTDNNGGKLLSDINGKNSDDLKAIANKSLLDLRKDNPDLLVFPQDFGVYSDDVERPIVFSLKGDSLETYNLMGFIGKNDMQLTITSRFAQKDEHDYFLHYMLGKVLSLNIVNLDTTTNREGIEDFLPYLFPVYLKKALAQGIFKQYRWNKYNNANVRGAIDVNRHIIMNVPFEGNIAYRVREYGYDNDITELVRHTIEHIRDSAMGSAILTAGSDIRSDVQKIVNYTPSYNKNSRRRIINANRKPLRHPYFTEYLPLQRLCLQILKYEKVSLGADKDKIHGLLFDGAWIWEEYLNTLLADDFTHPRNKTKEGREYLFCDDAGKETQEIYPDFIGRDKTIIADAKYKHLEYRHGEYGRDDYFQIIAYMYRFRSNHGFLLFPHPECPFCKNYTIKNTEGRLTKLGLAIPQQKDSFKNFCEQMRENEENFKVIQKV